MNTINTLEASAKKKERAMSIALGEGIKYGLLGLAVGGIGTLAGIKYSPRFNKYMSTSAKTSVPLMAGLFMFGLQFELSLVHIGKYPELYGLADATAASLKKSKMPFHHKAMNFVHDQPLLLLTILGIPVAGSIFYKQMQLTHLKLSQRVMHTRVYAQGGIIAMLLVTMTFRDYMSRHGRYPEPVEDDEEE